jgi:hypothetical protein
VLRDDGERAFAICRRPQHGRIGGDAPADDSGRELETVVAGGSDGAAAGNRRTAAYPALQPEVETVGAEYVDCAGVVDGVMVSARAWPVHPARMRAFIRLLRERAPVEEREAVPV